MVTTGIIIPIPEPLAPSPDWVALTPDWMALSSGLGGSDTGSTGSSARNDHNWTHLSRPSALSAFLEQNICGLVDWLENSDSSVSLDDQKLAQLIGNKQKLETETTSQIFSRQIPPDFPATSKN